MNIGFLSESLPYLPSRGGFRLYGGNLIRCLSQRHNIDLISLLRDEDNQHVSWPQRYCRSVGTVPTGRANIATRSWNLASSHLTGRPTRHRAKVNEMLVRGLRSGKWDVLHVEGEFAGGIVDPTLPIAKVLSVHDSWTLRCQEMLRCSRNVRDRAYYMLLKHHEPRYERLAFPRYQRCVAVAPADVEEIQRVVPEASVALIPYGTDTEYFHPVAAKNRDRSLVFHSHLGYAPNIEAALEFAKNIFPLIRRALPDSSFHLVGASPSPEIQEIAQRPGIRLSANLPDLRFAVCSSEIYVCPIRYGTGLKSKMLEAMAMRMPIVCYPGSTVGIDLVPGRHALVAADASDFAAHVVHLLEHPEEADRLARAGRELVERKYSWESRAQDYEALYEAVRAEFNAGQQAQKLN